MSFQIAIDGPVASGKGTLARRVAQELSMMYIDTGAMYRVVALSALRQNVALEDIAKLVSMIAGLDITLRAPTVAEQDGRLSTVICNDEDVSWAIRTETVTAMSSKVAVIPAVRQALVALQQRIAQTKDVVMEGRDITFRVLPQAQVKVFLLASEEVRAQRRYQELHARDERVTYEQILADVRERDERDMHRTTDPLHKVPDAHELDTTHLSVEQAVSQVVAWAHAEGK